MAKDRYSAADIRVLEGLEPVRVRPGMYIGGTNSRALHHLLWEVIDNSVDEALAGRCSTIRTVMDDNEVITISDDGRGIPTNVEGAYRPVDWSNETAVRLDDGALITMFNNLFAKYNACHHLSTMVL